MVKVAINGAENRFSEPRCFVDSGSIGKRRLVRW